ncbi:MAG: carcinine hydrolase/isopenicillin-N N-acyltransferase family protein [Thermoprotei archaeon]
MCTIIGVIDPNSLIKVIFMVNRDKPVDKPFTGEDLRIMDEKIVGVYDYRSKGIASGFSLKSGVYGAVANILGYMTENSRGVLLYKALAYSTTLKDAINILYDEAKTGKYSAAVYVLGDENNLVKIENFKENISIKRSNKLMIATNFLESLDSNYYAKDSIERMNIALDYLSVKNEYTLNDFLILAKYHGKTASICRHGNKGQTLSSTIYIMDKNKKLFVKYAKGNPCTIPHKEFMFSIKD